MNKPDPPRRLIIVVDVRRSTCTRCNDPSREVVAVFWSDLSGEYLCACEECLPVSMERLHDAHEIDDVLANFNREDIETELREKRGGHGRAH